MAITKINITLFKLLESFLGNVHYISPDENVLKKANNYVAFRYEKGEDFTYVLTLDTWTNNEDIEWLENVLDVIIDNLDRKIIFDNGNSFRFYYSNKGEMELIENSDIIGREINFEMKIC